jgi:hypothetical protein
VHNAHLPNFPQALCAQHKHIHTHTAIHPQQPKTHEQTLMKICIVTTPRVTPRGLSFWPRVLIRAQVCLFIMIRPTAVGACAANLVQRARPELLIRRSSGQCGISKALMRAQREMSTELELKISERATLILLHSDGLRNYAFAPYGGGFCAFPRARAAASL